MQVDLPSPDSFFLIDNDVEDREIFSQALNEVDRRFICRTASSAETALEMLANDISFVPVFIFVDMNMPLMNGLACVSRLRALPKLSNSAIYIYSTAHSPELDEKARQAGARGIIEKPTGFEDLKNLLASLIIDYRHHETTQTL
jgi:CheY-like chemotaxis protein